MYKSIALLKAKPGMSREDFVRYYETRHAPLIRSLLPQIVEYRRNFIDLEGAFIFEGASAPDFDVITEIWYQDRAAYDAMVATVMKPEIDKQIAEDEARFLDRSKTRMFVVDEKKSA
jgi:uncharacterized protein (TIGR02118 family)